MTQDRRTEQQGVAKESALLASRRSLLVKGLTAAPLIATVASRPAWAVTDKCSISGNMSGNVSNADQEIEICRTDLPKAEGLSPGYWHKWYYVYTFILQHPTWDQALTKINGPFKCHGQGQYSDTLANLGDGHPLVILYNWSRAADYVPQAAIAGLGLATFHPTLPSGAVGENSSTVGQGLNTPFPDAPLANLYAAILSTALPGSNFPIPNATPWSALYIVQNYNDPATRSDLMTLISAFFEGDHLTPTLESLFTNSAEEAYRWARYYLFGVPQNAA